MAVNLSLVVEIKIKKQLKLLNHLSDIQDLTVSNKNDVDKSKDVQQVKELSDKSDFEIEYKGVHSTHAFTKNSSKTSDFNFQTNSREDNNNKQSLRDLSNFGDLWEENEYKTDFKMAGIIQTPMNFKLKESTKKNQSSKVNSKTANYEIKSFLSEESNAYTSSSDDHMFEQMFYKGSSKGEKFILIISSPHQTICACSI